MEACMRQTLCTAGSLFALEVLHRTGMQFYEVATYAVSCGVICLAVFRALKREAFGAVWDFEHPFVEVDSRHIVVGEPCYNTAFPWFIMRAACSVRRYTRFSAEGVWLPHSKQGVMMHCFQSGLCTSLPVSPPTCWAAYASMKSSVRVFACAGAVMGALAAGLALAFMHFHWGLKKIYLRLGLHVRASKMRFPRCP